MIRDQRHMTGAPLTALTPEAVESLWLAVAISNPGGFANRLGERSLLETGQVVDARIDHSRWLADCPACGGGIACWPDHPRCCCLDCGRVYEARFPPAREKIEALLLERPEDPNRNWGPGETARSLAAENKRARELGLIA